MALDVDGYPPMAALHRHDRPRRECPRYHRPLPARYDPTMGIVGRAAFIVGLVAAAGCPRVPLGVGCVDDADCPANTR